MVNYYLEKVRNSERQLANAKRGFNERIKELANKLATCPEEEVEATINEIVAERTAMKDLNDTYEYNLKAYRKAVVEGGQNNG